MRGDGGKRQGFIQRVGGPGIPLPSLNFPPRKPENLYSLVLKLENLYSLILMHDTVEVPHKLLPPHKSCMKPQEW